MTKNLTIAAPPPARHPVQRVETTADKWKPRSLYGVTFWLAYISNTLFNAAAALLFRYADFIVVLGGAEWNLGWIVGIGMVGSLAVRRKRTGRYGGLAGHKWPVPTKTFFTTFVNCPRLRPSPAKSRQNR